MQDTSWLSTPHAAARIGLAPSTLEKLRVVGGGPRFGKFGRAVRYSATALDDWTAERIRSSTSDAGVAA